MKIQPKNWKKFQHYNKRNPPWIKLHKGLLDDYEYQCLHDASKVLAIYLWLLASEYQTGEIDLTLKQLCYRLRVEDRKFITSLLELEKQGFMHVEHDGDSTMLARLYQDATPETERETERERETEEKSLGENPPAIISEKKFCFDAGKDIGIPPSVIGKYMKDEEKLSGILSRMLAMNFDDAGKAVGYLTAAMKKDDRDVPVILPDYMRPPHAHH